MALTFPTVSYGNTTTVIVGGVEGDDEITVKIVFVATILTLFIVVTITGQMLVILAVVTEKSLRTPSNYCIVSLALCDLILAVTVMPVGLFTEIKSGQWLLGETFCDIFMFFDVLCCTASIFNLCLISIDRYFSITSPIRYFLKRTPLRAVIVISLCWVCCILISITRPLGLKTTSSDGHFCGLLNEHFRILSSIFSFYLPLLVMLFTYYKIFQAARSRLQKIRDLGGGTVLTFNVNDLQHSSTDHETSTHRQTEDNSRHSMTRHGDSRVYAWGDDIDRPGTLDDHTVTTFRPDIHRLPRNDNLLAIPAIHQPIHASNAFKKKSTNTTEKFSLAKERKAARTLGVVMGAFIICWAPFFLFNVIVPYCASCVVTTDLFSFVTWLGYGNSMLNPFIYTYFNKDFRRAFKRLLLINYICKSK
ncbi:5-hydroxytryptamine receptor 1A-like [Glandiceps talaboti]